MYKLLVTLSKNCVQPFSFFLSGFEANVGVGKAPGFSAAYQQVIHTRFHATLSLSPLFSDRFTHYPHGLLLQLLIN